MEEPTNNAPKNEQMPGKQQQGKDKKKKPVALWISIALNVILLAIIGWLWWQLKLCTDDHAKIDSEKKQLQTQVEQLQKQLTDAQSKSSASANSSQCTGTVSQSLKDNIHDAITSGNTAALEGYMTNPVGYVIAASEKGGTETPAAAVSDLTGNIKGTSGWNFSLPAATLNAYKAGFYGQNYFGANTYVGKAAGDQVLSFDFDSCGKIKQVFFAASADLLLQ